MLYFLQRDIRTKLILEIIRYVYIDLKLNRMKKFQNIKLI
nr:MAG TPA: hypothetical protein [Caudoviricetes sp.]